jgi:alpha-L-fucosidase
VSIRKLSRREWVRGGVAATVAMAVPGARAEAAGAADETRRGAQRLSVERLRTWEALGYGVFIHFGMSTFDGKELSDGRAPAALYEPDRLDVDQWVSVARDAGMKYAVLTAKHVAGHCLWPSRHTAYTVASSTEKTDVCEKFVSACGKRGVLPGFYYCSWDNHNRFGSRTPSDQGAAWGNWAGVPGEGQPTAAFTTSVYQNFQTLQLTELLTGYGPIAETWIDIPGVLGPGYREFLYGHVAHLQPDTVVMMNSGIGDGETYDEAYAWPSDLIAIERALPPATGHRRWREIGGREHYLPGEVCEPIGKNWFWVAGDQPRPDANLLELVEACRTRGTNLLLDVPPDRHGRIPDASVQALLRLRRNAGL